MLKIWIELSNVHFNDSKTLFRKHTNISDYKVGVYSMSRCILQAIKDVAVRYVAAGVPVAGIGVQSHLKNFDVHLIKVRNKQNVTSIAGQMFFLNTHSYLYKYIVCVYFRVK